MSINKREYGIDVIKILAALLVIIHHHLSSVGYYDMIFGKSNTLYFLSMLQAITLTCVPLFLVSSGYLLANRKIEKNHFVKIFYFLSEVFIIYTLGAIIYEILIMRVPVIDALKNYVKLILAPNNYVNLYTTLFIFCPFYNKLYFSLDTKERKLLIIIIITFISIIRLQNLIPHFVYFSGWPSASYPTLYYFIGLRIFDTQPKFSKVKLLGFIIFCTISYSLFMRYYMSGRTFYYLLGHYEGVFTTITTTLLFLLLYDIKIEDTRLQKVVRYVSAMTLSFYLLGGNYTDRIAMEFISISSKPLFNIFSFVSKLLISSLLIMPVAWLVKITQKKVTVPLLNNIIESVFLKS